MRQGTNGRYTPPTRGRRIRHGALAVGAAVISSGLTLGLEAGASPPKTPAPSTTPYFACIQSGEITGVEAMPFTPQFCADDPGEVLVPISGPKGAQGVQGAQGFQGAPGAPGTRGLQGTQGNQGSTGTQGLTGPQGSQGNQGTTGTQGFQGAQGAPGFQGPTGVKGNQGFQGGRGFQGIQGAQGGVGVQGTQGAQGNQGFQGAQGFQGVQGFQGAQGSQGAQGGGGVLSSYSAFSPLGALLELPNDSPEPLAFTTEELSIGSSISEPIPTSFVVTAAGDYRVSFDIQPSTLLETPGIVQVYVNGVAVGPTATSEVSDVPLINTVTFPISAGPATITIDVTVPTTGNFAEGAGSSVTIDQIG